MADALRLIIGGDGAATREPLTESDLAQRTIDQQAHEASLVAALHAGVKAEAQRRIVTMTGAPDLQSCMIKQLNALMRATELTNKKASGEVLANEEQAEADTLQALANGIRGIRSASDAIEAMTPIPANFADNSYWSTP